MYKNAEQLGYKVGDKFLVVSGFDEPPFPVGDIVTLIEDDGSLVPLFRRDSDGECHWMELIRVEPYTPTPAEKLGYKEGDTFRVTDPVGTIFCKGDIVTLIEDDGSPCPRFQRASDEKRSYYFLSDVEPHIGEVTLGLDTNDTCAPVKPTDEKTYPYIGRSRWNGLLVVFTAPHCGVQLTEDSLSGRGGFDTTWVELLFDPIDPKTLEADSDGLVRVREEYEPEADPVMIYVHKDAKEQSDGPGRPSFNPEGRMDYLPGTIQRVVRFVSMRRSFVVEDGNSGREWYLSEDVVTVVEGDRDTITE